MQAKNLFPNVYLIVGGKFLWNFHMRVKRSSILRISAVRIFLTRVGIQSSLEFGTFFYLAYRFDVLMSLFYEDDFQ